MRDQYCVFGEGKCEDVRCYQCPDYADEALKHLIADAIADIDVTKLGVFERQPRSAPVVEGVSLGELQCNSPGALDPDDVDLFMPDNVMHPRHYSRWAMEPIEFIAINDLPWWLANVIKYTMRYDAKDGLQDLYKARSYLEMKIRAIEGIARFWDKPVNEERTLNELPKATA